MNELAVVKTSEVTPTIIEMAREMGEIAYKSGMFKLNNGATGAMIMLKGHELGFPMSSAFEYIDCIQGKIGVKPMGVLALCWMHPEIIKDVKIEHIEKDGKYWGCSTTITRTNGFSYTATFSMEDAQKAGLIKDDSGWKKYERQMCQWRSLGFAGDVAAPDLIGSVSAFIKMPEILPDDQIVDISVENPNKQSTPTSVTQNHTMEELLSRWSGEQIMTANNGTVPGTDEEIQKVYAILSESAS